MEPERGPNRTLIFLLTIAVSIFLLEKVGAVIAALGNVVGLLALSWLLAFTLLPLVNWLSRSVVPRRIVRWVRARVGDGGADGLERLRLPYGLAVAIVCVGLLAALILAVLELVPIVIDQIGQISESLSQFTENLPGSLQRVLDWLNEVRQRLITDFNIDPAAIQLPAAEDIIREAGRIVTGLGQFVLDLVTGVVSFLAQVLLVLLIAAYMMIDGRSLVQQLMRALPDRLAGDARLWISTIDRTFGGFIRGTLLQAFIYGTVVTLLMLLFRMPYALVVGVATGVLMIIPYLGGVIGLLLPLLAGVLQSSPDTLLLVVLLFAFQLLLFNLIMPRILSQALRMPTLLVFVSLIAGAQLMGVWGLVFGVPLAAALYSIGLALLLRAKHNSEQHAAPDAEPTHD
jgi:predicted PurR-regulated permease PerM